MNVLKRSLRVGRAVLWVCVECLAPKAPAVVSYRKREGQNDVTLHVSTRVQVFYSP